MTAVEEDRSSRDENATARTRRRRERLRVHPRLRRALLASIGVGALLAGLEVIALLIVLALAAEQMPARTTVRRWALALLALFGLNAAVLTVLAVAGVSWQPHLLVGCYLAAGVLAPCHTREAGATYFAGAPDWWSLAAGVLSFALLYKPFAGASTGRTMAMLSYASDSSSHLYLVQDIRAYGGYINLRAPVDGVAGMVEYPGGWAGNVALVVELLIGDAQSVSTFMSVVTPLIIACYALLIFFAAAVTLDVVQSVLGRISPLAGLFSCGCLALTVIVGVNVFLLEGGFYTQLMATTAILASISLLRENGRGQRQLLTLGLLTISVMHTWYLLAPALAAVLLVYVTTVRPPWRAVVVSAVPIGLVGVFPVLTGPNGSSQINAIGGSPLPTFAGIVSLLLVALVGVIYVLRIRGAGHEQRLALVAAMVSTLLLVVGVLVLQGATVAGFNYYAFKLFYTVFLLGTIAGTAAAAIQLCRLTDGRLSEPASRRRPVLLVLTVALGLVIGSYTTRTLSWPYARGETPHRIDGKSLDALFANHPTGLPEGTDAWMLDGCERVSDHIASKWAYDLSVAWYDELSEAYFDFALGFRAPEDVSMLVERAQSARVDRMEIYVHRDCEPEAWRELEAVPGVVVIQVA